MADIGGGVPMADDTIVRIYSMTKPLTSTAVMMLYEEGRFQLDDPITRFLPAFRDMRVYAGGNKVLFQTVPAVRDISFRDLLTHTSGLTYGFMDETPVDALYRETGVDFQTSEATLGEVVEKAAALPLLAQPGAEWNYSIATDVLGHLVAVISGQSFESFLRERVLAPLGMVDTDFFVPADKLGRVRGELHARQRRQAAPDRRAAAQPVRGPAAAGLGRRRAGRHRRRLHAVLPDDPQSR